MVLHEIPEEEEAKKRPQMVKEKEKRALQKEAVFFEIPTNNDTKVHSKQEHGVDSWRFKAVAFLHSAKIEKLGLGLLLLDVFLLFVELFLLASFPHCSVAERDAVSCSHRTLVLSKSHTNWPKKNITNSNTTRIHSLQDVLTANGITYTEYEGGSTRNEILNEINHRRHSQHSKHAVKDDSDTKTDEIDFVSSDLPVRSVPKL